MNAIRSGTARRAAGGITVAVSLTMLTAVAQASNEREGHLTVRGTLHATSDPLPDTTICSAQKGRYALAPGDIPESGTSTYTGTFTGTGVFCGHTTAGVGPDGSVPFVETDIFTGTVQGCGTGQVTYHVQGFVSSRVNPTTKGLPTNEDWQVVAGSGSGGLRRLSSGHGHDVGQINADSSIDTDFAGSVVCDSSDRKAVAEPKGETDQPVHAFNTDDQGVQPDGADCSLSEGRCSGRVAGKTVWTGDFQGTSTYVLNFTPHLDGTLSYEGVERMTVVVRGCGRGTFDMRITNGSYDPRKNLDSPGMPIYDTDSWSVLPGSASGALSRFRGDGTETITEFNNGKTKADLTGSISC